MLRIRQTVFVNRLHRYAFNHITLADYWGTPRIWTNSMYERILRQMREKIRIRGYVMTLHAEEEMNDDNFSIFDVERTILTGRIIERQQDSETSEWKYLVAGQSEFDEAMIVVAKMSVTDKMVVITIYREEKNKL